MQLVTYIYKSRNGIKSVFRELGKTSALSWWKSGIN